MQRTFSKPPTSDTAVVIAASALAIYGLRKVISYFSATTTETENGYTPPASLTALWGLSESSVVSVSSSLWMTDKKVHLPDTTTKAESRERRDTVKDVLYDVVLWIRPGSCFTGESTISFKWIPHIVNGENDKRCFLNFSGGVIERIWVNGTSIGRDGRPEISGPFPFRRRHGSVRWQSHRIVIDHPLLRSTAVNEVVIRYFSEYDRSSGGLCQLAEQSQYVATSDAIEEYVFSCCDGFEAHRIFPCFDQQDIKVRPSVIFPPMFFHRLIGGSDSPLLLKIWCIIVASITPFFTGVKPTHRGRPSRGERSIFEDDFQWYQTINALCHGKVLDDQIMESWNLQDVSARLSTHEDLPPHFIDMLGFPSSHPSRMLCRLLMMRGQAASAGSSSLSFITQQRDPQRSEAVVQPSIHREGPESGLIQSIPRTHNRIIVFETERPTAPCDLVFAIGPYHYLERVIMTTGELTDLMFNRLIRAWKTASDVILSTGSKKNIQSRVISCGLVHFEKYFDRPFPFSNLDFVYLPETHLFGAVRRDPFLSHGAGVIVIPESSLYFTEAAPTEVVVQGAVGLLQCIALSWLLRNLTIAWWEEVWWLRALALYLSFDAVGKPPLSDILAAIVPSSGETIDIDTSIRLIFHSTVKCRAYIDESNSSITQPPYCSIASTTQLLPVAGLSQKKGAGILRQMEALVGSDILRQCVLALLATNHPVRVGHFFSSMSTLSTPIEPYRSMSRVFRANNESSGHDLINHSLWIPTWLGRSNLNILHAVWAVSALGNISTFEIRQSAQLKTSQSYRPRRIRVDFIFPRKEPSLEMPSQFEEELVTELRREQLETRIESYLVDLTHPVTLIPEFVGLPAPFAVLLNTDDCDYCRIWLDSATLLFVESQLYTLERCSAGVIFVLQSPLMRLIVWNSLRDTMEDSELSSLRFVEIFQKQAPLEENPLVLSQAISFITSTLRLYIPDEYLASGCRRIRNAAIEGERRHPSPEMRALWQWMLAVASIDPVSVASLLERMDQEDNSTKTGGMPDFHWAMRGGYWRKDKYWEKKSPHVKESSPPFPIETPLNQDVRWILLESLWALCVPSTEPESGWWIAEREKRLAVEMDRDTDPIRVQNAALKCYAANPEESSMEECWNRFMSVSAMTYKEVISLMIAFNRRRLPLVDDSRARPWWSLPGFYRTLVAKKMVHDEWSRRTHPPPKLQPSELGGTCSLPSCVERFDLKFTRDVKALFFKVDPLLAKKVWAALCPIHRPTMLQCDALETAFHACANVSSRAGEELRRSIGASVQMVERICESRKRCLMTSPSAW